MSDPAPPLVTISLVTWNGLRWLPGCLASVAAQSLADFELLALDNASRDGSAAWLRDRVEGDARMTLEVAPENLGFAAAHDRNIARARGTYVLLLNQDIELDPVFLSEAVAAFEERPTVAAVQGRLLRMDGTGRRNSTLDTTGLVMSRDRRVMSRAQGQPDGPQHRQPGPVFGADGPAPVYRRAALLDARVPASAGGWEVLDRDFFAYKEDVDLAWRLRSLGWTAWYAPAAVGWHARGVRGPGTASLGDSRRANRAMPLDVRRLAWRNQRLMQVKNDSPRACLRDLPWIARREVISLAYMLLADPAQLSAVPTLLRALPGAMRKRRFLARRRRGRSLPQG